MPEKEKRSTTFINDQINAIKKKCEGIKPVVVIRCITYNHGPYIKDALDGFVKQKTDFPFVAIVHDDASTDMTAGTISEYAEKYPDIILPIYEKENQYSKKDGSFRKIMDAACKATGAKYIAFCEGDDYWVDPLKLQKQVDFLEDNPDYSMCVSNVCNLINGEYEPSKWNIQKNTTLQINDIILNGGRFIATCTIVVKSAIYLDMPEKTKNLYIGDYPLQIYMASQGKVIQLSDICGIYRIASQGSWTEKIFNKRFDYSYIQEQIKKEIFLLDVMDEVTKYKYHSIFKKRSTLYRYDSLFYFKSSDCIRIFLNSPIIILRNKSFKNVLFSFLPRKFKQTYNLKKTKNLITQ